MAYACFCIFEIMTSEQPNLSGTFQICEEVEIGFDASP